MKVLILHDHVSDDARPDETDTLVQVKAVGEALNALCHEWKSLGLTLDLDAARVAIERLRPDLVFNVVESLNGIGRFIHVPLHLLDAMRIPYTGVSAEGMLLTSNKLQGKRVMQAAGIPTPRWLTIDKGPQSSDGRGAGDFVSGKYIVKSVWEHASIGLSDASIVEADSVDALRDAIDERIDDLGGEAFAEEFINGREFNLALLADGSLQPQLLPPCEIVFEEFADRPKIVNYNAKWNEESFEYGHTPRRYEFPAHDRLLLDRMKDIAMRCWRAFGLHGHARVDFRVDERGNPFALEVNANPCLSPDAGFAAALEYAGIPYAKAIERIMADVPSSRFASRQAVLR